MKCWYYLFEGVFRASDSKWPNHGVYSSAMIPSCVYEDAKRILCESLDEHGIDLLSIEDDFLFSPEDYDREDPDNISWFSLYDEVERFNNIIFTPWQVFDK